MESRQSNKELVKQRGGNEKGSSFVISDVFFFSLLIRGKNFKSKPLFVQGALLLCLLPFCPPPSPWVTKLVYLLAPCFQGHQRTFLLAVHLFFWFCFFSIVLPFGTVSFISGSLLKHT